MDTPQVVDLSQIVTNIGIIIVGFKVSRHLSRMEFRVNMMWDKFSRKLGINSDDSDF